MALFRALIELCWSTTMGAPPSAGHWSPTREALSESSLCWLRRSCAGCSGGQ
jgi:hypothetical protein